VETIAAIVIYAALVWGIVRFFAVCTKGRKEDDHGRAD